MKSAMKTLSMAGLLLGASLVATPHRAAAQDYRRAQVGGQEVQVTNDAAAKRRAELAREAAARRGRSTTRMLCEDGSSSYSTAGCSDHGGLASRQYTPVPRASQAAVLHANVRSAVARGYANRVSRNAIARCSDGTYWHSTTRRNACYNHGGVAR